MQLFSGYARAALTVLGTIALSCQAFDGVKDSARLIVIGTTVYALHHLASHKPPLPTPGEDFNAIAADQENMFKQARQDIGQLEPLRVAKVQCGDGVQFTSNTLRNRFSGGAWDEFVTPNMVPCQKVINNMHTTLHSLKPDAPASATDAIISQCTAWRDAYQALEKTDKPATASFKNLLVINGEVTELSAHAFFERYDTQATDLKERYQKAEAAATAQRHYPRQYRRYVAQGLGITFAGSWILYALSR